MKHRRKDRLGTLAKRCLSSFIHLFMFQYRVETNLSNPFDATVHLGLYILRFMIVYIHLDYEVCDYKFSAVSHLCLHFTSFIRWLLFKDKDFRVL